MKPYSLRDHWWPGHRAVEFTEGRRASSQLYCLYMAGLLMRPLRRRGMPKLANLLGSHLFEAHNNAVIVLDGHGRLRLFLRDGYWINLLFSEFQYETEVAVVLAKALARRDVFFIDCGANIGYWSIVASSAIDMPDRVLAIEASPPVFEQLCDNAALNGHRFKYLLAAAWSRDNETLQIVSHDKRHAGSSVVSRQGKQHEPGYRTDEVRSVMLDTICEKYVPEELEVILKLDVEGAEIPALQGAEKLLAERRPLLVYEDHGNDPDSTVSQVVLQELGMHVYSCTDHSSVIRMRDLAEIRCLKTNGSRGYNFFACAPNSVFANTLAALSERGYGRVPVSFRWPSTLGRRRC
jgi:FkbM family methyltransferase